MTINKIAVVAPVFNEEAVLPEFYRRLSAVADSLPEAEFEFLLVNDGSTDRSAALLDGLAAQDRRVKVLHLAANFGHQIALSAGVDHADADLIVTMDADLQDSPELIPAIKLKIEEGYDIIQMQRASRDGESRFKLLTARAFYKFMTYLGIKGLVENVGDFRAFTRQVQQVACRFRERHKFLRGIYATLGFRQHVMPYRRDRRYAGSTKFSLSKMIAFALDGILTFSSAPLKFLHVIAITLWIISLAYLIKALLDHYVFDVTVPGWTSLVVLLVFFTGLVLYSLAIVGLYIGKIFEQGQRRPLYWIREGRNVEPVDDGCGQPWAKTPETQNRK